ncbi:MAG: peptide chain release factor N(5)-glutamine methyltransferase [Firmicutes bacterium HGW-Firmicutes-13]|nr:MAG: peptide chain release factor N(5)-glutamine methyltransferase [Firmicutes bacterium HGW-Firmicutes-13]
MKLTIKEALREASFTLKKAGITDYIFEAALLLAFSIKKDLVYVYTYSEKDISEEVKAEYGRLVERRASGVPYHYLTGEKEFMGLSFRVTPKVLIPRPETEILAEEAVKWVREQGGGPFNILDLCTGSGVLAVTLARMFPRCSVWGADISSGALEIARENARLHGVDKRAAFLQGDLWDSLNDSGEVNFSVIVSNPPYIPNSELSTLPREISENEPVTALDGGSDGLHFYRRITAGLQNYLDSPGILALEVGIGQSEEVVSLVRQTGLFKEVKVVKDYRAVDRVVVGTS